MKKKILLLTTLFLMVSVMTNAQEYWIEGFYERHGENQYTLKDIHTQGIYIDGKTSLSQTISGKKSQIICDGLQADMVRFTFDKTTTDCSSKWQSGFRFQYWDEDNYKWKEDVEACKGETKGYSEKNVVIMLVLDYSGSMREKISQIRSSAIEFIRIIGEASNNGNIHVGIIAFSGMKLAKEQLFEIRPLTKDNKYQFENFINNASKGMETALYFSMDEAINMMEMYVNTQNFSEHNFGGASMITFTDGLDNASINDNISTSMKRGKNNPYLKYLSKQLQGAERKHIRGIPVENWGIGYSGSENFTPEDLAFFEEVLMQTTPDRHHFILSDEFDKIIRFFDKIAHNLVERWENLNLYVGESQYGKVRWVLQCESPEHKPLPIPPTPEDTRTPWLGISAEFGYCSDFLFGLNFDMAFSINKSFAVGGRLGVISGSKKTEEYSYSYGGYYSYHESSSSKSFGFLIGPEVKFTYPENNALLVSCGPGLVNGNFAFFLRFGYKTKKPFFITAETLSDFDNFGGGIGIGWSFGGKTRKK